MYFGFNKFWVASWKNNFWYYFLDTEPQADFSTELGLKKIGSTNGDWRDHR